MVVLIDGGVLGILPIPHEAAGRDVVLICPLTLYRDDSSVDSTL